MTTYRITSPLEALKALEADISIIVNSYEEVRFILSKERQSLKDNLSAIELSIKFSGHCEIAPESHPLTEPHDGDVGVDSEGFLYLFKDSEGWKLLEPEDDKYSFSEPYGHVTILNRLKDGRYEAMPRWEVVDA